VNPIGIRANYDEGKRCAETLFMDYHRMNNIDIKIARIFNTYGPYMQENDGRVVSNFINQCLKGDSITIYGYGTQTRSFCYIDDLVDGLIKLMNSSYNYPVNLGNPDEMTINDLAHKICSLIDSDTDIIYKDLPQDDPLQRKPDISLAKELLD
jgi:UDP-glucuronate decarboxylase